MDNVWYGNEPVIVEAQFLAGGKVQPTTFTWRGRHWSVTGLGRQWDEADGRHVLVATSDGSRFELCLVSHPWSWRLLRAWEQTYAA